MTTPTGHTILQLQTSNNADNSRICYQMTVLLVSFFAITILGMVLFSINPIHAAANAASILILADSAIAMLADHIAWQVVRHTR